MIGRLLFRIGHFNKFKLLFLAFGHEAELKQIFASIIVHRYFFDSLRYYLRNHLNIAHNFSWLSLCISDSIVFLPEFTSGHINLRCFWIFISFLIFEFFGEISSNSNKCTIMRIWIQPVLRLFFYFWFVEIVFYYIAGRLVLKLFNLNIF